MDGVSGVGISFGADRIFDVLNQLDLYPVDSLKTTQLLFVNFGEKEESYLLPIIARVRAAGIRTELFPESAKMKKQMEYADTSEENPVCRYRWRNGDERRQDQPEEYDYRRTNTCHCRRTDRKVLM